MICNEFGLNTNEIINSANKGYPRNQIPLASPGVGGPCLTKDPYILDESVINSDNTAKSIFTISRDINNKIVWISEFLSNDMIEKFLVSFTGHPLFTHFMRADTSIF